ncbi:Hypothetical protein CINCED_3A010975, partial [Cinara cedri]
MIVSRQYHRSDFLKVNEYTFERVRNFKYLGADINEDANSHEEVKKRLIAANRCYFGLLSLFKSKLLSRKSKVTLYKVLVRPIALYASSTWATTKSDQKKSKGLIGQITTWKPNAKRPRGRPRERWSDRKKEDLKRLGVRNAEETAQNREDWRQYVVAAMGLKGLCRYILNSMLITINCIRFCGTFELELRGYDENETFLNPGIFRDQ